MSASITHAENYSFITEWGSIGSGEGQFEFPQKISLDSSGNVYVVDKNYRVQEFDSNGNFIKDWGSGVDTALDSSGNLYIVRNSVLKFDSNGNLISEWIPNGTAWGISNLKCIAVDSLDNVYIADGKRIAKLDSNGNFITYWREESFSPSDIAFDSSDTVYVADESSDCIQKFDSNLILITKWGSVETEEGKLVNPHAIAVDSSGNVYVAYYNKDRILKFDSNGTIMAQWGSIGSEEGQFGYIEDVEVDSSGNVYVADSYNHRIQKFAPTESVSSGDNLIDDASQEDASQEDISQEDISQEDISQEAAPQEDTPQEDTTKTTPGEFNYLILSSMVVLYLRKKLA